MAKRKKKEAKEPVNQKYNDIMDARKIQYLEYKEEQEARQAKFLAKIKAAKQRKISEKETVKK